MLTRLKPLWESITTSLWFLPSLLTAGAILLAVAAVAIPTAEDTEAVWWLHSGDAAHASELLSSLLTSMITMATLAISITMVVLTLAAGQLGPRLIRSFMADKRTQLMLGFLLSTIVYIVLIHRIVGEGAREENVPHVAVTLGTALVLVCVFVLLFFVHHLARSIVADTVIERVGRDLDRAIAEMLPEPEEAEKTDAALSPSREPDGDAPGVPLRLPRGGYVQAIQYSGLVACASQADARIALDFRPGQHLLPDGCHGTIRPAAALSEDLASDIAECIVIGAQPTAAQDLEFAMRQLVEIALRALSTGVNEPFTATAVIDRLAASLAAIMRRGKALGVWHDAEGVPRVTGQTTTFRGIVDVAFNQIRQDGGGQAAVLVHLQAALGSLADQVRDDDQRGVLADHVALVAAAGKRSLAEPYDLESLNERTVAAMQLLGERRLAAPGCGQGRGATSVTP